MTPSVFTQRSAFGFAPMWYWFHVDDCRKGSFIAMPADRQPWPDTIEWFVSGPPAAPDQGDLFSQRGNHA